jgi:hypothetical protein
MAAPCCVLARSCAEHTSLTAFLPGLPFGRQGAWAHYGVRMRIRVARPDHPEVTEVIASEHCLLRFRKRNRIRTPGAQAVSDALRQAFEEADLTRWAPTWVDTDRRTQMWALFEDLAFPLTPTAQPGTWLATTCLVRQRA